MDKSFNLDPKIFVEGSFKIAQYILCFIIFNSIVIPIYFYGDIKELLVPTSLIIFGAMSYNRIRQYSIGYYKLIKLYSFKKNENNSPEVIVKNKEYYGITVPYINALISYAVISFTYNLLYFI